jgi:hypothetical protein
VSARTPTDVKVFTSTTALAGYARHRSLDAAGLIEASHS